MRLNCIRTNSTTNEERIEVHIARLRRDGNTEWWIYLEPGVTGHESLSVKNLMDPYSKVKDWCACAGTPNSWDKLVVPNSELEKLKDVLRLTAI